MFKFRMKTAKGSSDAKLVFNPYVFPKDPIVIWIQ